jgi:hypothetical protein
LANPAFDPTNDAAAAPAELTASSPATDAASSNSNGGVRVYLELAGTTFTLAYVSLILVGMFHLWLRLWYFDLNALDYADLSDFLLAPARDPLIVLVTVAPIGLSWLYGKMVYKYQGRMEAWYDRVWPSWRKRAPQGEKKKQLERVMFGLMALSWIFAFSMQYEGRQSQKLKKGDADLLTAYVERAGEKIDTVRAIQLAQTSRFLVVWHPEHERSDVIPLDRIVQLSVPRLRTFAKDSAIAAREARVRAWDVQADADNAKYDSVTKAAN